MAVAGDPDLIIPTSPRRLAPVGARSETPRSPLTKAGQTFVVSSHDLVVTDRSDQVLVIRRGVLAAVKSAGDRCA